MKHQCISQHASLCSEVQPDVASKHFKGQSHFTVASFFCCFFFYSRSHQSDAFTFFFFFISNLCTLERMLARTRTKMLSFPSDTDETCRACVLFFYLFILILNFTPGAVSEIFSCKEPQLTTSHLAPQLFRLGPGKDLSRIHQVHSDAFLSILLLKSFPAKAWERINPAACSKSLMTAEDETPARRLIDST